MIPLKMIYRRVYSHDTYIVVKKKTNEIEFVYKEVSTWRFNLFLMSIFIFVHEQNMLIIKHGSYFTV